MKERKIPLRKCVATNEQHPKGEMFRIVHTAEGTIVIDPSGKIRGRGAYLSKSKAAVTMAMKKKILDRHLETPVPEEIYQQLLKILGENIE
jgi:hypothetical protein